VNLPAVIGFVLTWVLIIMGMGISNIGAFIDIPSIQIVVLGTIAALFFSFPIKNMLQVPSCIKIAFFNDNVDAPGTIKLLVEFAEQARREGILALEASAQKIEDQFLKKGIGLAVDGTEPDLIRDILKTEMSYIEERHTVGVDIMEFGATIAPAMGMIGTLVGLILMLGNMSDIATIGPNMAVALLTTMYGSMMANALLNPIANMLKMKSANEILVKNMMLEGIMSLQSGDNPRIVEQKLAAFIDPATRADVVTE
jgi:chemotaxis protein MotA